MNMPHVRDKARVLAGMKGHTLGRFMWNPPALSGYRRAPADQQGLAVCIACEATVSTYGQDIAGTALKFSCPFHYTQEMLDAIDAAFPIDPTAVPAAGPVPSTDPAPKIADRSKGDLHA
jgi:hypothetical protein